jgi:glycine cleavage system H lipoate-binding protein
MKTYVDGMIWTETDTKGIVQIGFRKNYIEDVLGECFHVVQADTRRARKGCPLMVLETNDGTNRVRSPVTGTILTFNDKARNFPDRLTEDDVIVSILPEGMPPPKAEKKAGFNPLNQVNVEFNEFIDQRLEEIRRRGFANPAAIPPAERGAVRVRGRVR